MPFIYERLNDEDKKRVDLLNIEVNLHSVDTTRWVIDRELDAFLIWAYPEREPPYSVWYAFWLQGKVYRVAIAEEQGPKMSDGKTVLHVQFAAQLIGVPHAVASEDPVYSLIKQAIEVELRGPVSGAGWRKDISEIRFKTSENNKGAN